MDILLSMPEAILSAAETRTSAPVRILRGEDFFNGFLPKLGRVPVELEQVI